MKSKYTLPMVYLALLSMLGLFFYLWLDQNSTVQKLEAEKMRIEDELRKAEIKQTSSNGKIDLESEETMQRITAKIPYNEKEPFAFLKNLTRLATQSKMKNIKFTAAAAERYYARGFPVVGGAQDEGLYSVSIQMDAEGEFYQLIGFLKQLDSLDRIVTVDSVQVLRDENLLPYQKISLKLKVYAYLASDSSM